MLTTTSPFESKRLRHLAVIMDGNGRWAEKRNKPRCWGHKKGLETVGKMVELCSELEIEVLTLFAFSSENWRRPQQEVNSLMELFTSALHNKLDTLKKHQVQLRIIGNVDRFSAPLRQAIEHALVSTRDNTGLKLIIAVNYSGQWDIFQAAHTLIQQVQAGLIRAEVITQELFAKQLSLADLSPPDLLIRTSGECRISNFLLWQLAYTELYFTEVLWPDFDHIELNKALSFYAQRERRFGCISDQFTE